MLSKWWRLFSHVQGLLENVQQFIPQLCFFFFFVVEISLYALIPLFRPGSVHSVPWQVVCELISGQVPTLYLDSGIVSPLWLPWGMGVWVFRCNLPSALLSEWLGSFTCHCSNTGVELTLNKSRRTKLALEKKILLLLMPGFKLATFWLQIQHSTNMLSWLNSGTAYTDEIFTVVQGQFVFYWDRDWKSPVEELVSAKSALFPVFLVIYGWY